MKDYQKYLIERYVKTMNSVVNSVISTSIQLEELLKENTDENIIKTSMCEECKDWQHERLWIG